MSDRTILPLTAAVHPTEAQRLPGALDHSKPVQVTVVVRSRVPRDERRKIARQLAAQPPHEREHLSPREFTARYGSRPQDLKLVSDWARDCGLRPLEESEGRRCVVLEGPIEDIDRAFGVRSSLYATPGSTYRSYRDEVQLPEQLEGVVMGVLGLDDRAHVFQHARPALGFTPRAAVMEEYDFPAADGTGQTVGILGLGGGFHPEDLAGFLGQRTVRLVELGGQRNDPSPPDFVREKWDALQRGLETGVMPPPPQTEEEREAATQLEWTIELTADIQNVAAFAPGADVVVYLAPDSIQGKYTAFTTALIDEPAPQVLSCSWGDHEDSFPRNNIYVLDDVLEFAALRGITVVFSSGDDGDGSTTSGGSVSAHYPACSPHVLACGGTMGMDTQEEVWSEQMFTARLASGGGVSQTFGVPWWQPKEVLEEPTRGRVGRLGRGIPDVAGKADMRHGFRVVVGGVEMPIGGTSTAAPLWAALLARVNQDIGAPVGYVTPMLYLHRDRFQPATRSIERGDNGIYRAGHGWDACTGWGTPRGRQLARALRAGG